MNRLSYFSLVLFIFLFHEISANAVVIVNAEDKTVLQITSSETSVVVVNQVATVTSTQTFVNQLGSKQHIKYAFPMFEDAAATSLRWKINGVWHQAVFEASPADTTLPGGEDIDPDLDAYLKETPLYFDLTDSIGIDSTIIFELIYVQLLHYAYNTVSFDFPNDYTLISSEPFSHQSLEISIASDRGIVGSAMLSHSPDVNLYTESTAELFFEAFDIQASADYQYEYYLNPDELGLFSFSTFLPDTVSICDNYGRGYFSFILEPDPGDTVIIEKVFTLIIDRSGSMSGDKVMQAKDAANFVIDNLNLGDQFNIIEFNSEAHALFADHVPVTIANQNAAHTFVNAIDANGGTNIIGSFELAIPQFEYSDDDVANIIIFMTDGLAGTTEETLAIIDNLITDYDVEGLSINCFGIGYDVNEAMLSQIASENNGIYESFAAGDLLAEISDFYLSIQNPVLLNTSMEFDPPLVHQVYPDPLPNLYAGHQLIVTGRYEAPGDVSVSFSGEKYGAIVTYEYAFSLTDSAIEQNMFLTKLWAIEKINNMMSEYYVFPEGSEEADSIKDIITSMSLCYHVISPFTSFSDNGGFGGGVEIETSTAGMKEFLTNYPNPFRSSTTITFAIREDVGRIIPCVILDLQGNVIQILSVFARSSGEYQIMWDGTNSSGMTVNPGLYPYYIMINGVQYRGIMEKI